MRLHSTLLLGRSNGCRSARVPCAPRLAVAARGDELDLSRRGGRDDRRNKAAWFEMANRVAGKEETLVFEQHICDVQVTRLRNVPGLMQSENFSHETIRIVSSKM